MMQRPTEVEYPPYYADYVKLVPEGEIVAILEKNLKSTISLFNSIPEATGDFRYAPNKWSIKEVLGHMADTERIMSVRLLRFGRGDTTPLSGFEENLYIKGSNFHQLSFQTILDEFISVRNATLTLIKNMPEEAWERKGMANNYENTARALAFIIAGHELHHCKIIKERYLKQ